MRTPEINTALENSISTERLEKYLLETGGDLDLSIELYEENMLLSESFYVPLQCLEVCLRNKIHAQMSKVYGTSWLLDHTVAPLTDHSRSMINDALEEIEPEDVTSGKIVAELKFAFWVGLMSRTYDSSIWRAALYKAFAATTGQKRSVVHGRLNMLRRFRNRVAHHEPIFHKDLEKTHNEIIETIIWMCPKTAKWAEHHSRTLEILKKS
ncbi:Abi family protein [Roseovarius sp. CAU 1744]|uniref:Abi family protein n=1 Tax=Roseovarius sp. CAU 1744 TaxID=3140368 RepID=UPI00325B0C89